MASLGVRQVQREGARKQTKKGVTLNIMIVGRSGLGKSTFLRTLVERDFFGPDNDKGDVLTHKTVEVIPQTQEIEDLFGSKVILTLIDTPGFGDSIDNTDNFQQIEEYVEEQYQRFLDEESRISRNPKFLDTRVHCVLYMITPSGHALKELDIQFMKALGNRVNIIPVIAKADTLAPNELVQFKRRIMEDIDHYQIPVYAFPANSDEESDIVKENEELRLLMPFSVIGSDQVYDVGGQKVHGRKYPWGLAQVENEQHCDFLKLQEVIFSTHLQVLKEVTNDLHYENFRAQNLQNKNGYLDSKKIEAELQARERQEAERRAAAERSRADKQNSLSVENLQTHQKELSSNSDVGTPTSAVDEHEESEEKPKKKKTIKKAVDEEGKPKKKKEKSSTALDTAAAADDALQASV